MIESPVKSAKVINRDLSIWLYACVFMVCLMVTIGGLTRLTGSGLSMTDWKPATGFIPPLSESSWIEHFESYKETPEYIHKNNHMDLEDFKGIFWLEFIHRVMGRITGIFFIVPLIFFWASGHMNRRLKISLVGILFLGGAQGLVGWFMVKSGLKDMPYVDPYWLAFHLSMAMIIFSLLLLQAISLSDNNRKKIPDKNNIKLMVWIATIAVIIQMIIGAFVAGLDAGLIYNTFPDMNGQIIPDGLFPKDLGLLAIFEDVTTAQFTHRTGAYIAVVTTVIAAIKFIQTPNHKKLGVLLLFLVSLQFILGVLTIIWQVPISIASAHQVIAFILLGSLLYGTTLIKRQAVK